MTISIIEFYQKNTIEDNFDEKFYSNEYPDTIDFYQPYCKENNISEKERLFYHYKIYGKNYHKNLLEKNKNIFNPIQSNRQRTNKLAVITSFFNPCNYTNIKNNYIEFSSKIQQYADLFPIELSFDGKFFIDHQNVIQIHGTNSNTLWQKEALLNIALSKLPCHYSDVAWIDCDVIFHENSWVSQLYEKLEQYKIVQLFNQVYKIDANNHGIPFASLMSSFPRSGEAGFAWAARREILDEIQLLDNQIFGGGDFIMASAFMNKPHLIENLNRYINNDYTKQWIQKVQSVVDQSVSYIDTTITHLYHGNIYNREYSRQIYREKLTQSIDVNKDIYKKEGLWNLSLEHIPATYQYFISRQEDDNLHIKKFLETNFISYEECLDFYTKYICDNLMQTNPHIIVSVQNKMKQGIIQYAEKYSKTYQNFNENTIYTRQNLDNKQDWLCENIAPERIIHQHTSGSTTGEPFNYYSDHKYFDNIQRLAEFDTILKEYHLYKKPLKILNLFKHPYNPKPSSFYLETKNYSNSKFHNYGATDVTTYFVNWDDYITKVDYWHEQLLGLLSNNRFDIVLSSGPVFNILCRYIKKHNFNNYFAYLLSHTTEFPKISDFEFLKENGNITHYCDHMRCWDGGASFFTCKYGIYHLHDNLSCISQGTDYKMISTDYFNMVSPFINYWNGDLCEITNDYKLCDCGRYYRPFKMLENRPFALKGPTKLTEIKKQIGVLEYRSKIDQIQFENLDVNIYLNKSLTVEETSSLQHILQDYKVNFYGI